MSNIDEVCNAIKSKEAENEILMSLKESGKFSVGGIEKDLTQDDLDDINAKIATNDSDLDKMIAASNTNMKTSISTIAELKALE